MKTTFWREQCGYLAVQRVKIVPTKFKKLGKTAQVELF